jgi:hypothetical protein
VSQLIQYILQDINSYMRLNDNAMGELKKTTLRLGNSHLVNIVVGADSIKASIRDMASLSELAEEHKGA